VHHVTPWARGGNTDIDDMALLCKPDHRMVHESGWTIRIANGYPEFIPPNWLDPDHAPRRKPRSA
jgi:hypothetical protein